MKTTTKTKSNGKITVKLGRIISGLRKELVHGRETNVYPFIQALRKLGDDPMPVRERYAAGRTLREATDIAGEYEKAINQLIELHGRKQSEVLAEEKARLEAESANVGGSVAAALKARLQAVGGQLSNIEKNPQMDFKVITPNDFKAIEVFKAEVAKIEAEELTLSYLDHRIPVALGDPDKGIKGSALTGEELEMLDDLIQVD